MWPRTREDQLLERYLREVPGELFLEVSVGAVGAEDPGRGPRRIDGVLLPGERSVVRGPGDYRAEELNARIVDRAVHLLEAKYVLNRKTELTPADVVPVAVCGHRNSALEGFCEAHGIRTAYYPDVIPIPLAEEDADTISRVDFRKPINSRRRRAFMAGWTTAVEGTLYGSIRTKKTHANMGNLFGWIYGDQPEEFRLATWEQYAERFNAERP